LLGIPVKKKLIFVGGWLSILCICMLYRLLVFLFAGQLLTGLAVWGQSSPAATDLPQRVPPAPTTAALERYALMPINEASGTPDISLPLLQAQSGSLSLPLSLTYHASGIRVDDEASWVGLGWSLNAGGVITRVVRGKADESSEGFLEHFGQVPQVDTLNDGSDFNFLRRVAAQETDYEADLFTYSFPGGSGTFMVDNEGVFQPMPYQPLRITATREGSTLNFSLVDQVGTTYAFTAHEFTTSRRHGPNGTTNCSAWYLTQIVSADRTDTIRLAYDSHTISYPSNYSQSLSVPQGTEEGYFGATGTAISAISTSNSFNTVAAVRLREITFRQGRIVFTCVGDRSDIGSAVRLTRVALLRADQSDTLRTVTLYQSYFNGDLPIVDQAAKMSYLRLRLDSIQLAGGAQRLPPYKLSYSAVRLPTRGTGPRDHWGYANASYQTSPAPGVAPSLIPRIRVPIVSSASGRGADGMVQVGNTSREPNSDYVQAGLLVRLSQPTGGYVAYTYEANTALARNLLPATQRIYNLELRGVGTNELVQRHDTLIIGSFIDHLSGSVTIRQINESGYTYKPRSGATITIRDLTDNNVPLVRWTINKSGASSGNEDTVYPFSLPVLAANHCYEVVAEARGDHFEADINLYWDSTPAQYHTIAKVQGGVRVKTIRTYASGGSVAQARTYAYNVPHATLTSGYSISPFEPKYDYEQTSRVGAETSDGDHLTCYVHSTRHIFVGSQPIGELQGGNQSVGYEYVTVTDSGSVNKINGQTISRYARVQTQGTLAKPYPPALDFSWQRGNLQRRWLYRGDSFDALRLVEQQAYDYADVESGIINGFRGIPDVSYSGCVVGHAVEGSPANANLPRYANRVAYCATYQLNQWHFLQRSRTYQYAADTSKYVLTTTSYTYGNKAHAQPTQIAIIRNGQQEIIQRQYVADYDTTLATTLEARAIREMSRRHMNAVALETITLRQQLTDPAFIVKSELKVPTIGPHGVYFQRVLTWDAKQPQMASQFTVSQLRQGRLILAAEYQPKFFVDQVDALNRVITYHMAAGSPVSYLWGAQKETPLAEARNATVQRIAYTSFEPGEAGQWRYATTGVTTALPAFTGKYSYLLSSGDIQKTAVPAGDYLVAFRWDGTGVVTLNGEAVPRPAGTGWLACQYRLHLVSPKSITITGTGRVDELRLCPVEAQLVSFTSIPLVGMSSQTGPDGRTTSYEYDGLGRLVRTRDEQGRILSQQQYHYAGGK
jgi:YD repeat-containing protein